MRNFQAVRLLVGAAMVIVLTMAMASPANAGSPKCSGVYGPAATHACIVVNNGSTFAELIATVPGYFQLPTIVDQQCNGLQQNCVAFIADGDSNANNWYSSFYNATPKATIYGHLYRAIGSWTDVQDGHPYVNAVSPFSSWDY
jgi:hypothetical protein